MRHVRSLDFDALEARKLLTKAHPAVVHADHAVVTVPLELNGTLAVDMKQAVTISNADGSETTATPVAGTLSGVGEVRGVWNVTADTYGDYIGPDTLQLRDSKGTFVVAFNDANPGRAHKTADGFEFKPLRQRVHGGTGAYARATETGTLVMSTTSAKVGIQSLTLATGSL